MAATKRSRKNKSSSSQAYPPQQLQNKDSLVQLFDWWIPTQTIFSQMTLHGNTHWLPLSLVLMALLWTWSSSKHLVDAFDDARRHCDKIGIQSVPSTYQGMMGALCTWRIPLRTILCRRLQTLMQQIGGRFWRQKGWVLIAVDGSRSTAPRTQANEKALCAPNHGKGTTARYRKKKSKNMRRKNNEKNKPAAPAPQLWITLMWHAGLRLPWSWRLGPSNSSERAHAMDMTNNEDFPRKTLICGDAGFVGYDFWKSILDRGLDFLVRVGGNVSLLAENCDYKRLCDCEVLCWPKGKQSSDCPPLRLRLVKIRLGRKKNMFLLTSVVKASRLTAAQVASFYQKRWGVEVEFRGLKQTLDRADLRCRKSERAYVEMDWSLLGMAMGELFALKEQLGSQASGEGPRDPNRRSLAEAMRVLRRCLRDLEDVVQLGEDVRTKLAWALTDDYQRTSSKRARYRPSNPDKKPLGEPKIEKLTREQRNKLREIEPKKAA
jgi:hypothetical protein